MPARLDRSGLGPDGCWAAGLDANIVTASPLAIASAASRLGRGHR
jgi:hypothetical protein